MEVEFQKLAIALGLGLLVGLQRERVAKRLAGIRTFPLVTVLGTASAMLADTYGGYVLASGWVALAAVLIMANLAQQQTGEPDPGMTTEVAMLLMFGVGAYLAKGHPEVAVVLGGGVAVLLQLKVELHGIVRRLGEDDLKQIMQFVLLSLVILPVLPNKAYGPYSVINPYQIWLMVVLIVGLSLAGYVSYKFLSQSAGLFVVGILGGLISSTATTVSYSRQVARASQGPRLAAAVIIMASVAVYGRVILEIAVVAPTFIRIAAPPFLVMMALLLIPAVISWLLGRNEKSHWPSHENPSELKAALVFGLLFATVLLAVASAKDHLGDQGIYLVAALSGLTDMDAITLSTSQLVEAGRIEPPTGWKLILFGSLANLVFKAVVIGFLAGRQLLVRVLPTYGLGVLAGTFLLAFWS